MTGRESFRSPPDQKPEDNRGAQDRLDAEYRRFLEKVVEDHPELKNLGKDRG